MDCNKIITHITEVNKEPSLPELKKLEKIVFSSVKDIKIVGVSEEPQETKIVCCEVFNR